MNEKGKNDIVDFIAVILFLNGVYSIVSSIIHQIQDIISDSDSEKWFSRLALGLICLGFAAIIFRLNK